MRTETKKCPSCQASIPLISNVCMFCGEELTAVSENTSAYELMYKIVESTDRLENEQQPEITAFLLKRASLVFSLSIFVTFFFAIANDCTFPIVVIIAYFLLGTLTFLLSVPAKKQINTFLKNLDYEVFNIDKYTHLYELYYSNDSEIKENTQIFNTKIKEVKAKVNSTKIKARNILYAIFIVLNLSVFFITGGVVRFYKLLFIDQMTETINIENVIITDDSAPIQALVDEPYTIHIHKNHTRADDYYVSMNLKFKRNTEAKQNEPIQQLCFHFVDDKNKVETMSQQSYFYADIDEQTFAEDKDIYELKFWGIINTTRKMNRFIIDAQRNPNILVE